MRKPHLNRREFLQITGTALGGALLSSWQTPPGKRDFPPGERLGRLTKPGFSLRSRPSSEAPVVRRLGEDEIVQIEQEVVGEHRARVNQTWLETPEGFAWSAAVQPVRNEPNQPVDSLPETSLGSGLWAVVTVPYVNLNLDNPPARAPWLKARLENHLPPRFFYGQVVWVDQIERIENGRGLYRLNERYGYGDRFWAPAEGLRPITAEEMAPIRPEASEKRILVDVPQQTLTCYEGSTEVYFDRVSTGALYNNRGQRVDEWGTPEGTHRIWRKAVSLPLSGGSAEVGWDLPAVGWISLFVGSGVAFHSTHWHNNYGVPTSRGCVNCRPETAEWIFRWTQPSVPYDPGDVTIGMPGGTRVEVVEA